MGVRVTTRVDEAVEGADVIMMLRIQLERMQGGYFPSLREYFTTFGMTEARVKRAKPDVIIMHPGPINRGVEIASEVADGTASVILDQVANGVAVRMAVLYLLAGWDAEAMKRYVLKGGRVVDPANGRDGMFDVLIDGDRIAEVGTNLNADGAEVVELPAGLCRVPGLHRHARAPARARAGAQGNGGDRRRVRGGGRLHRGGVHAEHQAGERQRRRHAADPAEGRGSRTRARLSDWRGLARTEGRRARRHRRAERGRLRRGHRRRAAGGDGDPGAARARVHQHVRHADDRALRGSDR